MRSRMVVSISAVYPKTSSIGKRVSRKFHTFPTPLISKEREVRNALHCCRWNLLRPLYGFRDSLIYEMTSTSKEVNQKKAVDSKQALSLQSGLLNGTTYIHNFSGVCF